MTNITIDSAITGIVDIREVTAGSGTFGLYSESKGDFLKSDGNVIPIQAGDSITLQPGHRVTTLDASQLPLPVTTTTPDNETKDAPPLYVNNYGQNMEMAGGNLSILGRATVKVDPATLAAGDIHAEYAPQTESGAAIEARQMRYEGHGIAARNITGLGELGRVDLVDTGTGNPLLTLSGDTSAEHTRIVKSRVQAMKMGVLGDSYEADPALMNIDATIPPPPDKAPAHAPRGAIIPMDEEMRQEKMKEYYKHSQLLMNAGINKDNVLVSQADSPRSFEVAHVDPERHAVPFSGMGGEGMGRG